MEAFEQILTGESAQGVAEVEQRLLGIFGNVGGDLAIAEAGYTQDVEQKNAVIRGDGTAAFRNDGRVRDLGFVTDILNVVHHVVGVLLQCIVDAGFEVGLRAVVVDPQSAAHVHVAEPGSGAPQFNIHARGFGHGALDLPDVGDLAAQVEVKELQAILHVQRL